MMKKPFSKIFRSISRPSRGFTILETLVAISVLIFALTAAFSVAQTGLSLSISSRDEVTAYYLAEEGVEVIRNMRDQNSLNNLSWLTNISNNASDPCYFGNYCAIDSPNDYTMTCGTTAGSCPYLKQDRQTGSSTYGMYGLDPLVTSSWTTTNFKREIFLKEITPDEIAITVTVYWYKGTLNRQFVVHENLFNWQR